MAGTWKSFNAPSGVSADTMILLTDATVLVHDANRQGTKLGNFGGANWYRLTPDAQGDYSKGQWAGPFPMANARQFFASGVLRDGRVYVVGGEFSSATPLQDADPTGEIFDPTTNAWAPMTKPPSVNYIVGDCVSCVLADGRVLFGGVSGTGTAVWNPVTGDWTPAGTAFSTRPDTKVGLVNEESWCLLTNGNVLAVQITGATPAQNTEMYVSSTDTWISAGSTTQPLPVGSILGIPTNETGPAVGQPDGRALFVGGNGRTQHYTPGLFPDEQGTWAAGANLPPDAGNPASPVGLQTVLDGAAVVLPNGSVLLTGGPTKLFPPAYWSSPVTIYEYGPGADAVFDHTTQHMTAVSRVPGNLDLFVIGFDNAVWTTFWTQDGGWNPGWFQRYGITALDNQPPNPPLQTFAVCFLLLPNGHVLMTGEQLPIDEYTPDGGRLTPQEGWRPSLLRVPTVLETGTVYPIAGRQLTGLTQATGYGDDRQNASNYPLVRLSNSAGDCHYLRTFNFSTLGIATADEIVTASMQVPPGTPAGSWDLTVIVNGIASAPPVSVTVDASG